LKPISGFEWGISHHPGRPGAYDLTGRRTRAIFDTLLGLAGRFPRSTRSPGTIVEGSLLGKVGAVDFASLFAERVTIFAGHFGSGKTELTLNAALAAAEAGISTSLIDLDVVKPYFRSRSAQETLAESGVELVAPQGDLLEADLPVICVNVRARMRDPLRKVFVDAGGNDLGVRALSSVLDAVPEGNTAFLLVLNFRRPFTPDVESAIEMARAIEAAARLRFTGAVSNTHLMKETTPAVVMEGYEKADETARRLGIPLMAVSVERSLLEPLLRFPLECPVLPLRRLVKPPFDRKEPQMKVRTMGPIFKMG